MTLSATDIAEFVRRQDHLRDTEVVTFIEDHLLDDDERAWLKKRKLSMSRVLVGNYESTAATDKRLDTMFRRWNDLLGIDYFGCGGI